MNKKLGSALAISALVFGLSTGVGMKSASATGTVPPNVQTGIDNAVATVGALDSLALAALTVALMPLGAMLTLRFLNMVLSRV